MRFVAIAVFLSLRIGSIAAPQLLDAQFELPRGFHIYRAAGPDISGGSYALAFDGEGRLLVGDGNAVRRLQDSEADGIFDRFEVIATGLGWRGPQGLLVYGDRLYAVGGDGIQVFEGYSSGGPLQNKGRIGNKFLTGGDHDAHTLFRGHDGFLYLMAGNGSGISGRTHITEPTSPALIEREASIFRISPDGQHWECLANGGRNPPNLGMNYLGELFSFDSDMEWHVGLPWYRPTRLNHWVIGGDQGWQEVGAWPPYYIDCLPGILDVGRGSPAWGTFYEHRQFPNRFHNAFLVCDYRWKRESNDQYNTAGRLVSFFLKRKGASWSAEMETFARPKTGARDAQGKLINFALVDLAVAPDGSLILSDHNQGLWRIYYGEKPPTLTATTTAAPKRRRTPVPAALSQLLSLPQPGAEWSRAREEAIRAAGGPDLLAQLRVLAANPAKTVEMRLAALRYLAPEFRDLPAEFVQILANDKSPEIRATAATLLGLRQQEEWLPLVRILLVDGDPLVRRRAAEALMRFGAADCANALLDRLTDHSRTVRYAAMVALAHAPTSAFFSKAADRPEPDVRMRALAAALLRNELPPDSEVVSVLSSLLNRSLFPEERLDLLRLLALFQKQISAHHALQAAVVRKLEAEFPAINRNVRWEQARLLGEYKVVHAFPRLLHALETERDEVTQFHLAQAISRLPGGWMAAEEDRLFNWFASTQRGWFADFDGKGVEFPQFWLTTLSEFASHHRDLLLRNLPKVDLASLLGTVTLDLLAHEPNGGDRLIALFRNPQSAAVRAKIASALASVISPEISEFCRAELAHDSDSALRGALFKTLARQTSDPRDSQLLFDALAHSDLEVVRSAAAAIARLKPNLSRQQTELLLRRMSQANSICKLLDPLLMQLANPAASPLPARVTDDVRSARLQFWSEWYQRKFDAPLSLAQSSEKTDRQLFDFLLSDKVKSGDRQRGGLVYERLQCQSCHGGGVTPGREGRIFGPDLSGVTRRLSATEFAESLVYPSKQVAERYKAYEIFLNDGVTLTGFITEQDDSTVTLADREQVHRIGRAQIRTLAPQATSLMPEHLLNSLTWDEIKDLVAFLDENPSAIGAAR